MKKLFGNLTLIVASLAIAIVVFESILRIIGFSYPNFHVYDEYTGIRHRPGQEGWFTREGKAYIRINSMGLRDHEHVVAKPRGAFRIAVLGDSFTEALQVPIEQTFWAVLEKELNTRNCAVLKGRVAEIINFGVSGFGTAQELITLERHVWQYSPDLVLLAFFTGNDVRNNSRDLEWEKLRPFFFLENGRLALDNSFVNSQPFQIRRSFVWRLYESASQYSRTVQMLVKVKHDLAIRKILADKDNKLAGPGADLGLDIGVYTEPRDKVWTEAWNITEQIITKMRNEVQSKGARFLLVSLSNSEQVNPDESAAMKLVEALGVQDLFYPDRRLKAFGSRENIETIVLAPRFLEYAKAHGVCLHGFGNTKSCVGHWNEKGHQLAGKTIERNICDGFRE